MSEQFERLREARQKAGYASAAEAARAMGAGLSTYAAHENGTRGLKPDAADRYARFFRVSREWLLFGGGNEAPPAPPAPRQPEIQSNVRRAPDEPPVDLSRFRGPRDVPMLGTAVGGTGVADADFQFNGQTVDYAPRPPGIADRKGVYGLWVSNDSMFPKFEESERLYVDSLRAPAVGDYVIVELLPEADGEVGPGFIKRLVRRTPTKIVVSQFNPPKEIEFDREAVKSLHRVIPTDELLGL